MKRIKPRKKKKRVTLTEMELNRIKREITMTTTEKAMLLILLATADEKGLTDDEMVKVWTRTGRYAEYIESHIVKLRELKEMLERATDTRLEGW